MQPNIIQFNSIEIPILYEDNHLLVLNKPAGLLSQPDDSKMINVVHLLQEFWSRPYVGLVHRLDRNVSGVLVVAKRSKAAERLSAQIRNHQWKKEYLAWTFGTHERRQNKIESFLIKNPKNNTTQLSTKSSDQKKASLEFEVLNHYSNEKLNFSEVLVHLKTGKSHQIRAQLSSIQMPIIGDIKYGAPKIKFHSLAPNRIALHAFQTKILHPTTQEPLIFKAPLPNDLIDLKAFLTHL